MEASGICTGKFYRLRGCAVVREIAVSEVPGKVHWMEYGLIGGQFLGEGDCTPAYVAGIAWVEATADEVRRLQLPQPGQIFVGRGIGLMREICAVRPDGRVEWRDYVLETGRPFGDGVCLRSRFNRWAECPATDEEVARVGRPGGPS